MPSFWAGVGQCVGFGSVVAIPVVLFVRALQRDRPLTTWPTLFLAATAALAAHLALQMHCGVVDRGHIGVAHSSLGVLYALLAFVIVRIAWTLRPDKRRPV